MATKTAGKAVAKKAAAPKKQSKAKGADKALEENSKGRPNPLENGTISAETGEVVMQKATAGPVVDIQPDDGIDLAKPAALAADTMRGDLVSLIIDELKSAPDVWQKLSYDRQQTVIARVDSRVTSAIRRAVHMVASESRVCIKAEVESAATKDDIKAVVRVSRSDPQRHDLNDAVGKTVLIIVACEQGYLGGELPKGEKQQKELPLDDAEPVTEKAVVATGDGTTTVDATPGQSSADVIAAAAAQIEAGAAASDAAELDKRMDEAAETPKEPA